jgi:FMN phosphatase YigB (HAD superfamily)
MSGNEDLCVSMPRFKGVLLDWRGTLVTAPPPRMWVRTALQRTAGDAGPDAVDAVLALLKSADRSTVDSGAIDTDIALHRAAYFSWFAAAGLDTRLSDSLYAVECDASMNPFADDVELLLTTLHDAGIRIGIVSDIHFDLRPSFIERQTEDGTTWFDLVDAWMLSYELGVCKPDPTIFAVALDRLGLAADQVLMVGDRAEPDGSAVGFGITALLLPQLRDVTERRLHLVLDLVTPGWSSAE